MINAVILEFLIKPDTITCVTSSQSYYECAFVSFVYNHFELQRLRLQLSNPSLPRMAYWNFFKFNVGIFMSYIVGFSELISCKLMN